MKKLEARTAILYVHIRPSLKTKLKNKYKKQGYSTLSQYIDALISESLKGK